MHARDEECGPTEELINRRRLLRAKSWTRARRNITFLIGDAITVSVVAHARCVKPFFFITSAFLLVNFREGD